MQRLALGLALLVVVGAPAPALAWSNGPDGYNSYGTHDWILRFRRSTVLASLRALSVGKGER